MISSAAQPSSDGSEANAAAAVNAAATTSVHHAQIADFGKNHRFYRSGLRSGTRSTAQAEQMLHKVPPSHRAGATPGDAVAQTEQYLQGKDASHGISHKNGGSGNPRNLKWEDTTQNRARGGQNMSGADRLKLAAKWHLDNIQGAFQAGLQAAPKGAAIGAIMAAPLSLLTNSFRVMRGEISIEEATVETIKDTAMGAGTGMVSAFGITTIATACPPIAMALSVASPLLLTAGAGAMVYEFFKILGDHQQAVRDHYQQLTQTDLDRLATLEAEWKYQHQKNLNFLAEAERVNREIRDRPVGTSIEDALHRYLESAAIAQSLGAIAEDETPIFLGKSASHLPRLSHHLPPSKYPRLLPTQE